MHHPPVLNLPSQSASPSGSAYWGRLYGSASALAIAEYAQTSDRLTLVVTTSSAEAFHLEDALRFLASELTVLSFPDWETLPYDLFSPHQDIVSQRLKTLYQLPTVTSGVLVLPVSTLMQRLCPLSYIDQHALVIGTGDTLPMHDFRNKLVDAGYRNVSEVTEHGEFAVRGSLLDLFPMASDKPFRIDYLDDEIEAIYCFDPADQIARDDEKIDRVELLPACLLYTSDAADE